MKARRALCGFNSKYCCPGSSGVNAFCHDWSGVMNWCFPPVCLITRVVRHARACRATMTLATVAGIPQSKDGLDKYVAEQVKDPSCMKVREYCTDGWPKKKRLAQELKPYWEARANNFLLHGSCIVVPVSLRKETLQRVHEGHQGLERCKLRARIAVWWPGMQSQVEETVRNCHVCAKQTMP